MPVNNKIKRFIIWLCLGLYCITGILGTGNFVLCYGNDNHISLEYLGVDSCCKSQLNDSNNRQINLSQTTSKSLHSIKVCNECIDTLISIKNPETYYSPIKKLWDCKTFGCVNPIYTQIYFDNYVPININKIKSNSRFNLDSLKTIILLI